MSLNQLVNYERNEIIKNEIKAVKLGLTTGTDGEPLFISETGDKQLVTRKLTPTDFPYGSYSLYQIKSPFIKSIAPNVNADYYMIQEVLGTFQGVYYVDFRTLKTGDRIDLEYWGYYTNSNAGQQENGFRYTRLYFGNQFITWDAALDNESSVIFPASTSLVGQRNFKFRFQLVATSDWDPVNNEILMMASGNFFANNSASATKTQSATFRINNFRLEQSTMGRPDPDIINVLATSTLFPTFIGFVMYYEGMNYKITKGLYITPP